MVNFYRRKKLLEMLPKITVSSSNIDVLLTTKDYFEQLVVLINAARVGIYLTVMYLENDEHLQGRPS